MNQRGSTIVESIVCMLLLCLVLFGLLQIFHWTMAKMLCEYSSFYAAKGESLGYAKSIVERAGRVAAMGISGQDESGLPAPPPYTRTDLSTRAEDYMLYSSNGVYQVNYAYWDPATNSSPSLNILYGVNNDFAVANVNIDRMPLLDSSLAPLLGVESVNIPSGHSETYNHSKHYLENQ